MTPNSGQLMEVCSPRSLRCPGASTSSGGAAAKAPAGVPTAASMDRTGFAAGGRTGSSARPTCHAIVWRTWWPASLVGGSSTRPRGRCTRHWLVCPGWSRRSGAGGMEMSDEIVERTSDEIEAALSAAQAERDRRVAQLRHDARAVYSALDGWQQIGSQDDWVQACQQALESYDSGRFLIEQLGAERYLEPQLMAVLLGLRRGLVGSDGGTAAEAMLADLAVLSYYNTLRIQQWIGDLAVAIEHQFFAQESPTARFEAQHGRVTGLVVEEHLARLAE